MKKQDIKPEEISLGEDFIAVAQKVKVGDQMDDGTICFNVNPKKNTALFVPKAIFGGKVPFDEQNKILTQVNDQELHGYNDWRKITDTEGKKLAEAWNKVAPHEQQGSAAPWFWIAPPYIPKNHHGYGRVRSGSEADWGSLSQIVSRPVPVVRSGLMTFNPK